MTSESFGLMIEILMNHLIFIEITRESIDLMIEILSESFGLFDRNISESFDLNKNHK